MADLKEIALVLDGYDDIFSDFDPRPYQQRELSKDFIEEVQRRYTETPSDKIEVRFMLPSALRDEKQEAAIKRRLREHFAHEAKLLEDEIGAMRTSGIRWIVVGSGLLLGEVVVLWLGNGSFVSQAADTLLAPLSWFMAMWGLDRWINGPNDSLKKQILQERLSKANFIFLAEETVPVPDPAPKTEFIG